MASRSRTNAAARGTKTAGARAPPARRPRARDEEPASTPVRFDLSRTPLRGFAAHPHASAALLCALVVLAYLWPVLLGGDTLSPVSALYGQIPWFVDQPHDIGNYVNPLLSDVA